MLTLIHLEKPTAIRKQGPYIILIPCMTGIVFQINDVAIFGKVDRETTTNKSYYTPATSRRYIIQQISDFA